VQLAVLVDGARAHEAPVRLNFYCSPYPVLNFCSATLAKEMERSGAADLPTRAFGIAERGRVLEWHLTRGADGAAADAEGGGDDGGEAATVARALPLGGAAQRLGVGAAVVAEAVQAAAPAPGRGSEDGGGSGGGEGAAREGAADEDWAGPSQFSMVSGHAQAAACLRRKARGPSAHSMASSRSASTPAG
jgi:hypothetical protein